MAGRIPQTFIDDLLARVDIVDIIDSRVKLKKTGRNYSACCPFHKEKTPSFTVSPDKQFYYCFGCGASGNALGFIMEFDHMDFPEAIDDLAGQLGLEVPREQSNAYNKQPDYAELYALMEKTALFFQQQLRLHNKSPQAVSYLKSRGLTGQISQQFGIGFAPPGWDNLQTHFTRSSEKEKQLIKTGMLVENEDNNRIYDRFRDRIMFPIRDSRGRYIAFGGRILGDGKPKYLNSPETPIFQKGKELYGLYEARKAHRSLQQIIVVEGYMDVIALSQQGLTNSVATLGTATTPEHMQRLFKIVPEVIFCFDGDDAGRKAAWRALESTLPSMEDGRQTRFLFLPQGEDPDSVVRQEGPEAFESRVKSDAISMDSFLFNTLEEGIDMHTMDGRARLTKLAQPYIDKLPKGIFKQLIMQKLAGLTGLHTDQLIQHLSNDNQPQPAAIEATPEPAIPHREEPPAYEDYQPTPQQAEPWLQNRRHTRPSPQTQNINPTSKISGAGYAIRQLLCNTLLANSVDNLSGLKQNDSADSLLLVKLLETLKSTPGLSAIALIAREHDTANGTRLQQLATFDLGLQTNEKEFHETLDFIRRQAQKNNHRKQAETLKKELSTTSVRQISTDHRNQFEELMEQKRQQFHLTDKNTKKK
ncbi:DNA primase [Endozoicomonas sp.]|nr:DNA primase [Endozoicomonas sp.]